MMHYRLPPPCQQIIDRCDLVIVFGASAITDSQDVIPAGIEQAGGIVQYFGMPVDPGNLLLLAEMNAKTVIGAPGCARSPAENGFRLGSPAPAVRLAGR